MHVLRGYLELNPTSFLSRQVRPVPGVVEEQEELYQQHDPEETEVELVVGLVVAGQQTAGGSYQGVELGQEEGVAPGPAGEVLLEPCEPVVAVEGHPEQTSAGFGLVGQTVVVVEEEGVASFAVVVALVGLQVQTSVAVAGEVVQIVVVVQVVQIAVAEVAVVQIVVVEAVGLTVVAVGGVADLIVAVVAGVEVG